MSRVRPSRLTLQHRVIEAGRPGSSVRRTAPKVPLIRMVPIPARPLFLLVIVWAVRTHPGSGMPRSPGHAARWLAPNIRERRSGNLWWLRTAGFSYLIVGYGHFRQLVVPRAAGHVSIAFELASNPADHLQAILGVLAPHEPPA